ncbi:MAG: acetyl-CoA carboxylase biotin carboxyl carrier protein subunit, partial [SAR324 cluster bacterium]|nr:acetyl-CoA carboxylase biotin carboxyl carrier protein subunit [SAR324 cluster bacterium]
IDIPAPTPGNIVRLEVAVGESIAKEQTLLVMEAMKMESEVKSPQAGVVQAVHVQAGNTVQTGDTLITMNT